MNLRTSTSATHRRTGWRALAAAVLLVLQACSSTPTVPAGPPAAPAAPRAGTAADADRQAAALAVERKWLQSWFQGTPVVIAQLGGAAVSVDVPLEFCFDAGGSKVKPPLAAVLDKVAESLRRHRQARLELLAAPRDAADGSPLALQRATQVRAHLMSRGVPAARLGGPTTTAAAAVQLRLAVAAP